MRCGLEHYAAVCQDDRPVGNGQPALQAVRDGDDRAGALDAGLFGTGPVSPAAAQLAQQTVEHLRRLRVQPGVRLVQQQHFGVVQERPCNRQPLHHAARERAHQVPAPRKQSDPFEQGLDARLRPL